jgi:hypothetical protein
MSKENILIEMNEDKNDNKNDNKNDDNYENELENILKEINETSLDINPNFYNYNSEPEFMVKLIDYNLNYNIKQLLTICEYYGLLKEVKTNKMKKLEVIYFLLDFEENIDNSCIVYKRKQLWYFMSELKNDKFLKKFVLW